MKKLAPFFLLLLLSACAKEKMPGSEDDLFAFGTGYGFCAGDCAHLYQIRQEKLYPDNINNLYLDPITFAGTPLPDSSYQHARALPSALPDYLLQHPNQTFGCPDCYDQGVIYVELNEKGTKTFWKLDPSVSALPVEVQPFAQQILDVMDHLR